MAINCAKERWEHSNSSEQAVEEELDEDLSFCDLPFISHLTEEKEEEQSRKEDALAIDHQTQEEFDFPSRGGSLLRESEMCAADEVFFQGQILPLRLSVSSQSGSGGVKQESQNISRCTSRSESMDHNSTGGFTSNNSSRSSSTRSHNSTSSTSSNSTFRQNSKPIRVQNNFLTCPSPKPQIRISATTRQGTVSGRRSNSSARDFFRLGLVPTPEIGLQDLKVRRNISVNKNSGSRNSSLSSSSSSTSAKINNSSSRKSNSGLNMEDKQIRQGFLERRLGGLLSGCKCTDETVSSNVVIIKSNSESATTTHAKKAEKLLELKMKKNQEEKQQGKQAMSRHRTYEWLKELSHATYPPGS